MQKSTEHIDTGGTIVRTVREKEPNLVPGAPRAKTQYGERRGGRGRSADREAPAGQGSRENICERKEELK